MSKTKRTIQTIVPVLAFCLTTFTPMYAGSADVPNDTLNLLIIEADIVVEGMVINRSDSKDRTVQGYVGESETPVMFQFGTSQESFFKITKVYLGGERENRVISIFSYPEISRDVSELVVDKKYLLFLKRRKIQNGYVIVDFGRGAWRIFDYNGAKKVKAWHQFPALREVASYQSYDEFVGILEKKLSLLK